MSEIESQQLNPEVVEFLRKGGEKSAAYGCLSMAGQIYHSVHTLHLTRNQLDRKDDNYETKVLFLDGAIKVLEKELRRNLDRAHTHWLVSRGSYGDTSKDSGKEKEEALDKDSKGPQDNG